MPDFIPTHGALRCFGFVLIGSLFHLSFRHLQRHPCELSEGQSYVFADRFVAALAVPDQWPASSFEVDAIAPTIAIILEQINEILLPRIRIGSDKVSANLAIDLFDLTRSRL